MRKLSGIIKKMRSRAQLSAAAVTASTVKPVEYLVSALEKETRCRVLACI
jgi:hypothetical protein